MKYSEGTWMVSGSDQIVAMPSQVKVCNRISGADPEEMEANAKLIAAAPDLLEALILARDYIDMAEDNIWKQIDNAIKKATE